MVLEGATFGGHHVFGGSKPSLEEGPRFYPRAHPSHWFLGQIPSSKGEYWFDMDQASKPLMKN